MEALTSPPPPPPLLPPPQVWSALSLEQCGLYCGHQDSVTCLALDANFLFSGSEDTTIHMWDVVSTRQQVWGVLPNSQLTVLICGA